MLQVLEETPRQLAQQIRVTEYTKASRRFLRLLATKNCELFSKRTVS